MNVQLIDHATNPLETIYRAYRICYSSDVPTEIKIPDKEKVIEFIKAHSGHGSPLEHVTFTFAIEGVSRITEQQLTRHRIASYSIQSGRYVNKSNNKMVVPPTIRENKMALDLYLKTEETIQRAYENLLNLGIPKEDARFVNPQGQGTNMIVTMNLRELLHFFEERMCIRSQWEIRAVANLMFVEIDTILPIFDKRDVMKCGKTCNDCLPQ